MSYLRHGSAASHLGLEDVPSSSFKGIELVHLTGIKLALSETARAVVVETARRARALGLVVIFDPNYRPPLWDSPEAAGRACGELFPYVDWLLWRPRGGGRDLRGRRFRRSRGRAGERGR